MSVPVTVPKRSGKHLLRRFGQSGIRNWESYSSNSTTSPILHGISDAGYSFSQFKNDLEAALVDRFGRAVVKRGNKAFNIRENTYRVEADVVPLFEFRQYWESENYRAGVALVTDQGRRIENYPQRLVEHWPSTPLHYENGNSKR